MTAARRVRCDMRTRDTGAPRQTGRYAVIQRPYVASLCHGRPPLWGWRNAGAFGVSS